MKKTNNLPVSEMSEVTTTDIAEQAHKEIKHRNRPDLANFGQEYVKPGDNTRYIRHALAAWNLPPINLDDDKQVEERITWFFNHCVDDDMKPTVMGLCNALGISRKTLWSWESGNSRTPQRLDLVKKAKDFLAELWEDYMMNGKINPVSGIFLGKNHFGYTDEQTVVFEAKTVNNDIDPEDLKRKYLETQTPDETEIES